MQEPIHNHRRAFLAAVGSAMLGVPRVAASTTRLTPSEFQQKLEGPITSIPTVYTRDFDVDYKAVRRIVETGVEAGSKVFALTAGNSQYDQLTYDEIKQLTRTVVEAVSGRGLTIAATGDWWTGLAVDYAKFAYEAGADAIQVKLPIRGDEDTRFEHHRKIASAVPCALVLHGQVPLPLLKRLMELPSIVAYKEEYPQRYTIDVIARYGRRLNLFGGGQMSRFLIYQPYGMRAYYSTFATFAPEIPRRFWKAVTAGRLDEARGIMLTYDVPFFERFSHAFWRATLEYFGVAKRFLRPPDRYFTDEECAAVKAFFDGLGVKRS